VAGKGWADLKDSLREWNDSRREKAKEKIEKDATQLRDDIVNGIRNTKSKKTKTASEIEAKTNVSSDTKAQQLSPTANSEQDKSHLSGVSMYADSITMNDESSGTNVVYVVKIDDDRKKDETSGMSVAKIAKATEFGTRRSKPNPAWRRSLSKLEQTGVYRKKT